MDVVALFLKAPVLGAVKTRLAKSLGDKGALLAYKRLVEFLLKRMGESCIHVHHTPADPAPMESWLGDGYPYSPQIGPGLGERLIHAMEQEFTSGAAKLIFLGGDCPYVDQGRLDEAFAALDTQDVVLGPATDGGYYLIGMSRSIPGVFRDIDWGRDTVFESTLERCREEGLQLALLPRESDVDELSDWETARAFMNLK